MPAKKKWWLVGCGGLLALLALLAVGSVALWLTWGEVQPPANIVLTVQAPAIVAPTEEFDLLVRVQNLRDVHPLRLNDVVLSNGYLDGFQVLSVEPRPVAQRRQPLTRSLSFMFDSDVAAHATKDFVFRMKAGKQAGTFEGGVDIWEGLCFMSQPVQTRIRPVRPGRPPAAVRPEPAAEIVPPLSAPASAPIPAPPP